MFLLKSIYYLLKPAEFFFSQWRKYFFSVYKKNKRGAIMVEYALLIVVCVGLAVLLLDSVDIDADNAPDKSGFIIKKWWGALKAVAEDT